MQTSNFFASSGVDSPVHSLARRCQKCFDLTLEFLLRINTDSVMTCVNKNDTHWHNSWVVLSLFVGAKGAVDVNLK